MTKRPGCGFHEGLHLLFILLPWVLCIGPQVAADSPSATNFTVHFTNIS